MTSFWDAHLPAIELDAEEGRRRRDEAMALAEEHAEPSWNETAYEAVRFLALRMEEFTTDDVWALGLVQPREPRALGAVMSRAVKARLIERTNRVLESARPECHRNPKRVWRSLLFETP